MWSGRKFSVKREEKATGLLSYVAKTRNIEVFFISTEASCTKTSINHLRKEWKRWGKLAIPVG